MPRPQVKENRKRQTVTFTMEAEHIQLLKEYALELSVSVGVNISKGQVIESIVRDFLSTKKAAKI